MNKTALKIVCVFYWSTQKVWYAKKTDKTYFLLQLKRFTNNKRDNKVLRAMFKITSLAVIIKIYLSCTRTEFKIRFCLRWADGSCSSNISISPILQMFLKCTRVVRYTYKLLAFDSNLRYKVNKTLISKRENYLKQTTYHKIFAVNK